MICRRIRWVWVYLDVRFLQLHKHLSGCEKNGATTCWPGRMESMAYPIPTGTAAWSAATSYMD